MRTTYAKTAKCPCGAPLAYNKTCTMEPFVGPAYWDCSAILDGTANQDMQHTDKLPFTFYEIKAESSAETRARTKK